MMHSKQNTSSDPACEEAPADPGSPMAQLVQETDSIGPAAQYILLPEAEKAKLSFDSYLYRNDIELTDLNPSVKAFGTRALGWPSISSLPASPSPARLAAIKWHDLPVEKRRPAAMESFAREHRTSLANMREWVSESGQLCGEWPESAQQAFRSLLAGSRRQGPAAATLEAVAAG